MNLSAVATSIGAQWLGPEQNFNCLATDSRRLPADALFVALVGERFDGHDYIDQVWDQGAVAVMVSQSYASAQTLPKERSFLVVADTRLGLGAAAKAWLQQFSPVKIAITGSCGKTTVKEMTAAILSQRGATHFTQGNLNNDIGVPLTMSQVQSQHQFAVFEMGANHLGEIQYVSALVEPDIALVNNVGTAHLEGFGSVANIARGKGEIYQSLAVGGKAIVNLDDAFATDFLTQTSEFEHVTFSRANPEADVFASQVQTMAIGSTACQLSIGGTLVNTELQLLGQHNIMNALAAAAIAVAAGCTPQQIALGLAQVKPYPGRLCPVAGIDSLTVIDDTYNASPDAVRSAIDVLAGFAGERCLVLGDMAELGETSEALHQSIGQYAAQQGIEQVFALGRFAEAYQQGYQATAPASGHFVVATSFDRIAQSLQQRHAGAVVLIKGSRSSAMETLIACLQQPINKETI